MGTPAGLSTSPDGGRTGPDRTRRCFHGFCGRGKTHPGCSTSSAACAAGCRDWWATAENPSALRTRPRSARAAQARAQCVLQGDEDLDFPSPSTSARSARPCSCLGWERRAFPAASRMTSPDTSRDVEWVVKTISDDPSWSRSPMAAPDAPMKGEPTESKRYAHSSPPGE